MSKLVETIDRKIEQSLNTAYREAMIALKCAVEALRDPENHWHSPGDYDFDSKECTACSALAEIQKTLIGGGT